MCSNFPKPGEYKVFMVNRSDAYGKQWTWAPYPYAGGGLVWTHGHTTCGCFFGAICDKEFAVPDIFVATYDDVFYPSIHRKLERTNDGSFIRIVMDDEEIPCGT